MTFWNEPTIEPLRKRSFKISIGDDSFSFLAKTANKPTLETDVNEYRLINQIEKFPSVPRWNDITITFVDTKEKKISKTLIKLMMPKQSLGSGWEAGAASEPRSRLGGSAQPWVDRWRQPPQSPGTG